MVPSPATCDGKGPAGLASCPGGSITGKQGSFFWPIRKIFCNDVKNVGMVRACSQGSTERGKLHLPLIPMS